MIWIIWGYIWYLQPGGWIRPSPSERGRTRASSASAIWRRVATLQCLCTSSPPHAQLRWVMWICFKVKFSVILLHFTRIKTRSNCDGAVWQDWVVQVCMQISGVIALQDNTTDTRLSQATVPSPATRTKAGSSFKTGNNRNTISFTANINITRSTTLNPSSF